MKQLNPIQQDDRAKRAHVFNGPKDKPNNQCWCGKWHYRCGCGADCTMGQPAGPAHETEGETRCRTCYAKWESAKFILEQAAPGLLKAVVACLNAAPSLDHTSAGILARAAIAEAGGIQPENAERPRLVVTVHKGIVDSIYSDAIPASLPAVVLLDLDGDDVGEPLAPVIGNIEPLHHAPANLLQALAAMGKPTQVLCDNCGWSGPESAMRCNLANIPDLAERLNPGGIVPAGECPKCRTLVYPVNP